MRRLRRILYWLRLREHDEALREELEVHREFLVADFERQGMPTLDAKAAARRAMGDETFMREESRGVWFSPRLDAFLKDFQHAFRSLRRTPGFALTALVFLTVGLGLNTALFSMVDAVLLRGLPFPESERLVEIFGADSTGDRGRVMPAILRDLQARSSSLSALTIHGPIGATLRTDEGPVNVRGEHAWANFEQVYGVGALYGRTFRAGEDALGAAAVVVVSHAFWTRFLGGDTLAVGRTIVLDSTSYTVIGIMPSSFRTNFRAEAEFYWTPQVNAQTRAFEEEDGYQLVARLARNVDLATLRRELAALGASAGIDGWGANGKRLEPRMLQDNMIGSSARVVVLAFGAVAVVLIITCANIALFLLLRADVRIGEFATRKAIGASNASIIRLALAEPLLLTLAGGILGGVAAYLLLPSMIALAPAEVPRLSTASIDARVVAGSFAIALLSACGAGIVPALRLAHLSPSTVIGSTSARVSGRAGFRSVLVVAQVAGAIVLCVLAGLVTQTLRTLTSAEPGFDARGVNVFLVFVSPRVYPNAVERGARIDQVLTRLATSTGMDGVTLADNPPFMDDGAIARVAVDGSTISAQRASVAANYFDVMRIPMIRGRTFAGERPSDPHVAVLSRMLARRLGGEDRLIGQRVRVGRTGTEYEVIGIVGDVRTSGATSDVAAMIYFSFDQTPSPVVSFVTRSRIPIDADALVRKEIRSAFPALPLALTPFTHSMEDIVRQAMAAPRFLATFANVLSVTALALSTIGVFGLVAYAVSRRRRELGIRAALGARPLDLAVSTLRNALVLSCLGVVVGLGCALYLSRFVESQLYGVRRFDIPTFAGAAVVLLVATLAAAAIPSRRAAMLNPVELLRP